MYNTKQLYKKAVKTKEKNKVCKTTFALFVIRHWGGKSYPVIQNYSIQWFSVHLRPVTFSWELGMLQKKETLAWSCTFLSATVCFCRRSRRRSRCQRRQNVDAKVLFKSQKSPRKLHLKGQRHRWAVFNQNVASGSNRISKVQHVKMDLIYDFYISKCFIWSL